MKVADDSVTFDAKKLTGTNWHLQVFQTDLDLKEGQEYTLKVKVSATKRRSFTLVATIDQEDWHEIGLHEDVSADKEARTLDFTFRATGVATNKKNRIGFMLGDETGDLTIKEMTLTEKASK
jgi:hypothetical protein